MQSIETRHRPLSLFFSFSLPFPSTKAILLTCRNAGTSSYLSLTVGIGAVSFDGSAERKALRSNAGSNASAGPAAPPALAAAAAPRPPPPPPPFIVIEGLASSARDLGRGGAIRNRRLSKHEEGSGRERENERQPSAPRVYFPSSVFELPCTLWRTTLSFF